jgi:aspartate/methionine/tyrosine aminotransferase
MVSFAQYQRHREADQRASTRTKGALLLHVAPCAISLPHALMAQLRCGETFQVLLVPGSAFTPCGEQSSYVRAAFSVATDQQMDEAMRRFAALVGNTR